MKKPVKTAERTALINFSDPLFAPIGKPFVEQEADKDGNIIGESVLTLGLLCYSMLNRPLEREAATLSQAAAMHKLANKVLSDSPQEVSQSDRKLLLDRLEQMSFSPLVKAAMFEQIDPEAYAAA